MNEIAENQNVSKAAISDLINRSVKQLENYEKALGFLKIYEDLNNIINDMNNEDNQTIKNYSDRLNLPAWLSFSIPCSHRMIDPLICLFQQVSLIPIKKYSL